MLRDGGDPAGVEPERDYTRPGELGGGRPRIPSRDWCSQHAFHQPDGTWTRFSTKNPPSCGGLWILELDHAERVPACGGINYERIHRATLLRAYAEAFRLCRRRDVDCPDARIWMLYSFCGCHIDSRHGPLAHVNFKLAVACVAD